MVERPAEAMMAPAHPMMRWHRPCVLWVPLWTYAAASVHNADGNDSGADSGGNDGASVSNNALASPLRPLDAAVDAQRCLCTTLTGMMVEQPAEATTAPAHRMMRWHRPCVLWVPLWTYAAASVHNADGNDSGAASGGNDGASASNDALASPLRPLDAAVDAQRCLCTTPTGMMVEQPAEATTAPAHRMMRWHRPCVLWLLLWMCSVASVHNADGNSQRMQRRYQRIIRCHGLTFASSGCHDGSTLPPLFVMHEIQGQRVVP